MNQKLFFIEETDTLNGEANYSYVLRALIRAKTARGAMRKLGRGWRHDYDDRFNSISGLTCFFVNEVDEAEAKDLRQNYRISHDDDK